MSSAEYISVFVCLFPDFNALFLQIEHFFHLFGGANFHACCVLSQQVGEYHCSLTLRLQNGR
jgi:hypothetical protein